MEKEAKHLRSVILSYQIWMERQIQLGFLDINDTPKCFDRSRSALNDMIKNDRTIGSHCAYCDWKFNVGEKKITDNHVMFFHPGCKEKYYKKEDESLTRQDKY